MWKSKHKEPKLESKHHLLERSTQRLAFRRPDNRDWVICVISVKKRIQTISNYMPLFFIIKDAAVSKSWVLDTKP